MTLESQAKIERDELVALAEGGREPSNGMEKHFLRVLAGSAIACTPKEKAWVELLKHRREVVAWEAVSDDVDFPDAPELDDGDLNDDDEGDVGYAVQIYDADQEETIRFIQEENDDYALALERSEDTGWFYDDE